MWEGTTIYAVCSSIAYTRHVADIAKSLMEYFRELGPSNQIGGKSSMPRE
jgi:hypothetical protein